MAGDFNSVVGDEVRFRRGAPPAPAGDGALSDIADGALEHLTELRQPCWTFRAFAGGRLQVASRHDRVYTSMPSAVFSFFAGSAIVQGYIYRRDGASDHLPVLVRLRRRARRDPRLLPPVGRRVFERPTLYKALHSCISICTQEDVGGAQDQLEALEVVARDLAADRDLWPFSAGVATARDKARLALRTQRLWFVGRPVELLRLVTFWPDLARRFDSEGGLLDEAAFVRWVADLTEAEALEEQACVRAARRRTCRCRRRESASSSALSDGECGAVALP